MERATWKVGSRVIREKLLALSKKKPIYHMPLGSDTVLYLIIKGRMRAGELPVSVSPSIREVLARRIAGEIILSGKPGATMRKWRELFAVSTRAADEKAQAQNSSDDSLGRFCRLTRKRAVVSRGNSRN
jgi:hypothetical protein